MADVLLVNPPYERRHGSGRVQPLGLAYIAAALEQVGASVAVLDLANELDSYRLGDDEAAIDSLGTELAGSCPQLIGFGPLVTANLRSTKALADFARRAGAGTLVAGGPLCAAPGIEDVVGNYLDIDAYIAGDGEAPIVRFWQVLQDGGDFAGIPGLGLRGRPPPTPFRQADLSALPHPARRLLAVDSRLSVRRSVTGRLAAPAFLSRGCPFACTFCAAPLASGQRVRRFPVKWIRTELDVCADLGYQELVFYDDCLFVKSPAMERSIQEFADAIASSRWSGTYQLELRCDAVVGMSDDAIGALRDTGCRQINMGIEKGHAAGMGRLRKKLEPSIATEACHRLACHGVRSAGTFIIGGPGEDTAEDMRATVDYAIGLDLMFAQFNPMAIYPGTQLYGQVFASAPWLDLCLSERWAPQGDILWQSKFTSLGQILEVVAEGYRAFYNEERERHSVAGLPEHEHAELRAAYATLRDNRAGSWRLAAQDGTGRA